MAVYYLVRPLDGMQAAANVFARLSYGRRMCAKPREKILHNVDKRELFVSIQKLIVSGPMGFGCSTTRLVKLDGNDGLKQRDLVYW